MSNRPVSRLERFVVALFLVVGIVVSPVVAKNACARVKPPSSTDGAGHQHEKARRHVRCLAVQHEVLTAI